MTPDSWVSSWAISSRRPRNAATSARASASTWRAWSRDPVGVGLGIGQKPGALLPAPAQRLRAVTARGHHLVGDLGAQCAGARLGLRSAPFGAFHDDGGRGLGVLTLRARPGIGVGTDRRRLALGACHGCSGSVVELGGPAIGLRRLRPQPRGHPRDHSLDPATRPAQVDTGVGVGGGSDRLTFPSGSGQQRVDRALGPGGLLGSPAQLALRRLTCSREQPVGLEPRRVDGALCLGEVRSQLLLGIAPEPGTLLLRGLAQSVGLGGRRGQGGFGVGRGGSHDHCCVVGRGRLALRRNHPGPLEHPGGRGLGLLGCPRRCRLATGKEPCRGGSELVCFPPPLVEHPVALGLGRPEQQGGLLVRVSHDRPCLARRVGEAPGREVPVALGLGAHAPDCGPCLVVVALSLFTEEPGLGSGACRLLRGLAVELVGDLLGTPQEHSGGTLRVRRARDCLPECGQFPLHAPIMPGMTRLVRSGSRRELI